MNNIKTSHNWHPNTSVEFDANGIWLRVSLNVTPQVAKHLSPNNVQKGKHRTVYAIRMHIKNELICKNSMEFTQRLLLDNCMKNIRNAKEKVNNK